jgi:hypothetical protein
MGFIKGLNPLLQYVSDLMSVFQVKPIAEPAKYRDKVLSIKNILREDVSGLVNTSIDYASTVVSSVKYRVFTTDPELTEILNDWLEKINEGLRGKIPTGVGPLSKEYCRERWKGSSNLLLRTFWENKDGVSLPMTMFFVDGEDVICKGPNTAVVSLDDARYGIRVSEDEKEDIMLPKSKNEEIFTQMPYESWGTKEPQPYLMRRGIWHNLMFMQLLSEKGEFVVARALEYLFLIKKGTERLYLDGNISYSREDLEKVSRDFQDLLAKKKYEIPIVNGLPSGSPTYATQFDTSMEHLIPDYSKIINEELFMTIERRLLSGLGLVDAFDADASSRKMNKFNARPFMTETKQAVQDFQNLLKDIMLQIVAKNSKRKWKNVKINIFSSSLTDFISEEGKTLIRSLYDRGLLSRQTTIGLLSDTDFETEIARLKNEKKEGVDDIMFPPVITNIDEQLGASSLSPKKSKNSKDKEKVNVDNVPEDKKGPEKRNYKNASVNEEK